MRYRLRTLLILLAVGPPLMAGVWFAWPWYLEYRERQFSKTEQSDKLKMLDEAEPGVYFLGPVNPAPRRTASELAQEERERKHQQSIETLKALGVPVSEPNQ